MSNKNFAPMSWFCVGLSTLSCFILTLTTYIQTRSPISLAAFVVCSIGAVVFWITFAIETVRFKRNKK